MPLRSLIYAVDDELSIREVYEFALTNAGFDIRCFSDSEALYRAIREKSPDCLILDIMLDGADGYEILTWIRENPKTREIPVIMVSAKDSEINKVRGLNLGADDYLAKPFGVMELIARINAKLRSHQKSHERLLTYADITVNESKHTITVGGTPLTLTRKEYALLSMLVADGGKLILRDKLFENIWGSKDTETRTLDIHIGQLRRLLANSSANIETVRGVGYILK